MTFPKLGAHVLVSTENMVGIGTGDGAAQIVNGDTLPFFSLLNPALSVMRHQKLPLPTFSVTGQKPGGAVFYGYN